MGLLNTILGRTKPVQSDLDALFALPSASITLQSAAGMSCSGHAGVCFKPPSGQGFEQMQAEVVSLLSMDGTGGLRQQEDSYGYQWLVVEDTDIEQLVTRIHLVNSSLSDSGWGPQLLCSVFGFVPEPGAAGDARAFSLVYLYKRGTFYPFSPLDASKERRDTELELRIRTMLGSDLPVESDLTRWFPMWDLPVK